MGGQTDRFGQPIPSAPGYQTILNPDGSQPQMRNILRLGTGFTAVDDPNSEATSLTVDSAGGAIQAGTKALGAINFAKTAVAAVPSGTIELYADSTTGALTSKDQFGIVSVQPTLLTPVTSQWVRGLGPGGILSTSQPSSADLSDLTAVALADANALIVVGGGSYYALSPATLTGLRTLTLVNTGATDKQAIQVRVYSQGSNYLINDSAATLLLSVASGTKVVATFVWATGTGKFQLQSWNFFT